MALAKKRCFVIHDENPQAVADRINALLSENPDWDFSPIVHDGSGNAETGEPWYLSTLVLEEYEELELEPVLN